VVLFVFPFLGMTRPGGWRLEAVHVVLGPWSSWYCLSIAAAAAHSAVLCLCLCPLPPRTPANLLSSPSPPPPPPVQTAVSGWGWNRAQVGKMLRIGHWTGGQQPGFRSLNYVLDSANITYRHPSHFCYNPSSEKNRLSKAVWVQLCQQLRLDQGGLG
jgi:hypothetical protein